MNKGFQEELFHKTIKLLTLRYSRTPVFYTYRKHLPDHLLADLSSPAIDVLQKGHLLMLTSCSRLHLPSAIRDLEDEPYRNFKRLVAACPASLQLLEIPI
ncbi:hypothetical protein J6590_079979 [Homalodisca vitripennis]|nr:hypothetical protein J6590_079979 [Homalodisca vitripennis]